MLEKMFDRNQNIRPTKNVGNTSSNMHATRSNKCFITMFERVAGVLVPNFAMTTQNSSALSQIELELTSASLFFFGPLD